MWKHTGECSVTGCGRGARIKGFCIKHYKMNWKYGRTELVNSPPGTGWECEDGYRRICINYKIMPEHVYIAEKALGKKLPDKAIVHHVDENKSNNTPTNLVVCPNQKYHKLLHKRMEEFNRLGFCVTTTYYGEL